MEILGIISALLVYLIFDYSDMGRKESVKNRWSLYDM